MLHDPQQCGWYLENDMDVRVFGGISKQPYKSDLSSDLQAQRSNQMLFICKVSLHPQLSDYVEFNLPVVNTGPTCTAPTYPVLHPRDANIVASAW